MKRVLTWGLLALLLAASLPSCGCGDMEADLVFVNGSDASVIARNGEAGLMLTADIHWPEGV